MPEENKLSLVTSAVASAAATAGRHADEITLIAVSKTIEPVAIEPVLTAGHRHFGENRVQEAARKWPDLKSVYPDVVLHLIGPLQSNKTAQAVALFDVIHTVDRQKIADAVRAEIDRQNKVVRVLIQVNLEDEPQKSGVSAGGLPALLSHCEGIKLPICGLMCIPPQQHPPGPYFALLGKLAARAGLDWLSMGMSADFEPAIMHGATHIRVGSALFGPRPSR